MKRLVSIVCVLMLVLSSATLASETEDKSKTESIYSLLSAEGEIKELYVVNGLAGLTEDYGDYISVENLSNREELVNNEGEIQIPSTSDTFYYEGIVDNSLSPWHFDITYLIDGIEIDAKDVAGVSGELEILIDITEGHKDKSYFYDHYVLQIGLGIPEEVISNLSAEGATVIDAGGKKQIAYTAFPGKETHISLKAHVNQFEMDPVTFNAVQMFFDMDVDTDAFTDQLSELVEAIEDIDDGASELTDGMEQLAEGLNLFTEGYATYTEGVSTYASSGVALSDGLSGVSAGMTQLNQNSEVLLLGIQGLETGTFETIALQLGAMGMDLETLNRENYELILGGQEALAPFITSIEQTLALTDGLRAYINGVSEITPLLSGLSDGLNTYVDSAAGISQASATINTSLWEINQGMISLAEGMEAYKEGTGTFRTETAGMDQKMADEMDQMMTELLGDDAPLESFASSNNTLIDSVQFFYRTDAVQVEEIVIVEEVIEEEETFWDRLLNLFKF